jgi:hypothetical protein
MHSISGQALNDFIIPAKSRYSPTIFRNPLVAAQKKAPAVWVPMDIVPASAGSAGLSIQAPHRTAVLFVDFLLVPTAKRFLKRVITVAQQRVWFQTLVCGERAIDSNKLEKEWNVGSAGCGVARRHEEIADAPVAVPKILVPTRD